MIKEIKIGNFLDRLSSSDPTPGGGSASALAGAVSASLIGMVSELTVRSKKYADKKEIIFPLIKISKDIKNEFMLAADRDIICFKKFMECLKLPKKTEKEKSYRKEAIQKAAMDATLSPLDIMEKAVVLCDILIKLAKNGNKHALSDVSVAVYYAETAFYGAKQNVIINLNIIKDKEQKNSLEKKMKKLNKLFSEKIIESKKILGILS